MLKRALILSLGCLSLIAVSTGAAQSLHTKQAAQKDWDISATASMLAEWTSGSVVAERLDISARVLSVREDGCYIDSGSRDGVTVGQVFQIYRLPYSGGPEEVAGRVQIAWTREDYSFAEPVGSLDLNDVTTLHFARLVNLPPKVALISDTTEGGGGPELDRMLQAVYGLLEVRGAVAPILGETAEAAWRLVLTPDFEGSTLRASLSSPGGETAGTVLLDPYTGQRIEDRTILDPSYIAGTHTPFAHYMAPPGRRAVRIACGNVVAGAGDELAVLDGADVWIYDLSWSEPRLLASLRVSIPPGPVRHRSDTGALELVDLDGDGLDEICLAPPGASRGEVWEFEGDRGMLLESLPYPPRASDSSLRGVVVAPWLIDTAAFDPAHIQWVYPLTENESEYLAIGFPITDLASMPGGKSRLPDLIAAGPDGSITLLPRRAEPETIAGNWGHRIAVASHRSVPVVVATSRSLLADRLTILDPYSRQVLAYFDSPGGPIIDLALGDIDHDSKAEILAAVVDEEGVRIYF